MRLRPGIRGCYGASVVGIIAGFLMAVTGAIIILETSYVDNRVRQSLWAAICFLCVTGFSILLFSLLCCSCALRMAGSLSSAVYPVKELAKGEHEKEQKRRCWGCPTLGGAVNVFVWKPPKVVVTEAWPDAEEKLEDLKEVVTTIIEDATEEEEEKEEEPSVEEEFDIILDGIQEEEDGAENAQEIEREQSMEDFDLVLDAVEAAVEPEDSEAKVEEEENQDLEAELEEVLAAVEESADALEENLEESGEQDQQELEAELEAEFAVEEAEALDENLQDDNEDQTPEATEAELNELETTEKEED